ncbi:hypothetical protein FMH14_21000 [Vibrio alginolyticus]|nr:hypothetical protein [Vibrio alginolyticus]
MKKQILHLHQILSSVKALTPVNQRSFIVLIWAIVEHASRQSRKGKKEEASVIAEIRQFVEKLNQNYPLSEGGFVEERSNLPLDIVANKSMDLSR